MLASFGPTPAASVTCYLWRSQWALATRRLAEDPTRRLVKDEHIVIAHNVHKTYLLGVEGVPALRGTRSPLRVVRIRPTAPARETRRRVN